jgi:effector-binding domain-containing protein
LAKSGEVKVKTTNPQEVTFAVYKGSYRKMGEAFGKLVQWIEENGYEIVGPPAAVCHNDSHTALEDEQVSECQFPVRKRE